VKAERHGVAEARPAPAEVDHQETDAVAGRRLLERGSCDAGEALVSEGGARGVVVAMARMPVHGQVRSSPALPASALAAIGMSSLDMGLVRLLRFQSGWLVGCGSTLKPERFTACVFTSYLNFILPRVMCVFTHRACCPV
jgi:hypothetical protein